MRTSPDYWWLQHFWDEVVVDDPDRIWQFVVMHNADLWIRDALAWAQLRERQLGRGARFRCAHIRAWAVEAAIDFRTIRHYDIGFLGRTKSYESSRYAPYAHLLASKMHARFMDVDGRPGNAVAYGRRVFACRELDPSPDRFRRVMVDYGVLAFRKDEVGFDERRLLMIAGLSTLGTACLTLLLVDDALRTRLVEQVRELLPWDAKLRPDESFEICVRFEVETEERLANFLNDPIFTFQVEAVAIEGGDLQLREDLLELVLHPRNGKRRDTVSVNGLAEVPLTRTRFRLLQALVARKGAATAEDLCRDLGLLEGGETQAMVKKKKGLVARMIHDLNHALGQLPGLAQDRVIQMEAKPMEAKRAEAKRYVLTGVRGVLRS